MFFSPWYACRVLLAAVFFPAVTAAPVESVLGSSKDWTATEWSRDTTSLFGGRPQTLRNAGTRVIVRYSFYSAEYNLSRKNPVWVAHVNTAESVTASAQRTTETWSRSGWRFEPDANVLALAKKLGLERTSHDDFNLAVPDDLASIRDSLDLVRDPRAITRGHLAPNAELKGFGDDVMGHRSQVESFSLVNVSPQMRNHNAAIWSGIEEDSRRLATKYTAVAVITGPVFRAEGMPQRYTDSKEAGAKRIPIPTHFFKILIVRNDNRVAALAFLVPHEVPFRKNDRRQFIRSVRDVEDFTGINVMPLLGKNDAVETTPSPELLAFLQQH